MKTKITKLKTKTITHIALILAAAACLVSGCSTSRIGSVRVSYRPSIGGEIQAEIFTR